MKKEPETKAKRKKQLVLRKDSIRALDNAELPLAVGAVGPPPDGGIPTQ